jgi:hypothetical protein
MWAVFTLLNSIYTVAHIWSVVNMCLTRCLHMLFTHNTRIHGNLTKQSHQPRISKIQPSTPPLINLTLYTAHYPQPRCRATNPPTSTQYLTLTIPDRDTFISTKISKFIDQKGLLESQKVSHCFQLKLHTKHQQNTNTNHYLMLFTHVFSIFNQSLGSIKQSKHILIDRTKFSKIIDRKGLLEYQKVSHS